MTRNPGIPTSVARKFDYYVYLYVDPLDECVFGPGLDLVPLMHERRR